MKVNAEGFIRSSMLADVAPSNQDVTDESRKAVVKTVIAASLPVPLQLVLESYEVHRRWSFFRVIIECEYQFRFDGHDQTYWLHAYHRGDQVNIVGNLPVSRITIE